MKKLDVSAITDSSQMPVKKGTLQFLQDANAEAFSAIMIGLIGPLYNPATVYVINGCQNSGAGSVYSITSGAVFYNGEVFLVDAAAFTATGLNVAVFSILVAQYTTNADPVTFTDLVVRNIHNIRKISITQGASGSGIANYAQAFFLSFTIPAQLNPTYAGQLIISGVYPNLLFNVPAATNLNPVLFAGSFTVGDETHGIGGGGTDYNVTFAAISTASYYISGTIVSNGTPSTDNTVTWSIRSRTTTGFILHVTDYNTGVQNIAFEYILFAK